MLKYDKKKIDLRVDDFKRIGGGGFLTEFGACGSIKNKDNEKCIAELDRITNAADDHMQSWAYWQYKYYNDLTTQSGPIESFFFANGTLQEAKVKALARPYAQAVSGLLTKNRYDPVSKTLEVSYTTDGSGETTDIYLGDNWDHTIVSGQEAILSDEVVGKTWIISHQKDIKSMVNLTVKQQ